MQVHYKAIMNSWSFLSHSAALQRVYLQYVYMTGGVSDKRLGLFGRHGLGETSTLKKDREKTVKSTDEEIKSGI